MGCAKDWISIPPPRILAQALQANSTLCAPSRWLLRAESSELPLVCHFERILLPSTAAALAVITPNQDSRCFGIRSVRVLQCVASLILASSAAMGALDSRYPAGGPELIVGLLVAGGVAYLGARSAFCGICCTPNVVRVRTIWWTYQFARCTVHSTSVVNYDGALTYGSPSGWLGMVQITFSDGDRRTFRGVWGLFFQVRELCEEVNLFLGFRQSESGYSGRHGRH